MNKWDTVILNNGLKCILLGEEIRKGVSTGVLLVSHHNEEFVCNIDDVATHVPYVSSKPVLTDKDYQNNEHY
jgi:hypothetical protein|tara:strand:+ start:1731 stop:1946 length:216 start_codon:yes stop_codon:yes gene_type:complete